MPGVDLDPVAELDEAVEASEERLGALARLHGEVGPREVADEERVACQDEPRVVGTCAVGDRERAVLRAVSRRVDDGDAHVAHVDGVAVREHVVWVLRVCFLVDRDGNAVLERQPAVAGDVVRVGVRLQHARDAHAAPLGERAHRLEVERRVDDDGYSRQVVTHQVGRAAEILVENLLEQHAPKLAPPFAVFLEACWGATGRPRRLGFLL